jgi:acyl dehydratase
MRQHRRVRRQRWFDLTRESLVGFLEQASRSLKPVHAGDTIYPAVDVIVLAPGRSTGLVTLRPTVHNRRHELVLEGMQKFLQEAADVTVVIASEAK